MRGQKKLRVERIEKIRKYLQEDGHWQMYAEYRVPVFWMPIGYRIPGFLRIEIKAKRGSTAHTETGGPKSMSDKNTVWRLQGWTRTV
jgi:hypothetical protein